MNSALQPALEMEAVLEKPMATGNAITELATESADQPSKLELFSYIVCCAVQGLIGLTYLALITLVPVAIQQGMLF
jgi:Na+/H+ antiporter NhaC